MHIRTDVPGSASVQVPPARFKRFRAASGSGSGCWYLGEALHLPVHLSVAPLRCHAAARRSGSVPLRQPTHVFKTCTTPGTKPSPSNSYVRKIHSFIYIF